MDYNKEEADMDREAAINKFLAKDYAEARRFALRAQSLNPKIVGITQMVATFALHLAAQQTINGEIDYYAVFGIKPEANDDTVQKRYKKLAVILHPDKNKSIGAEEASKLVSEAWSVLSDKAKRDEYDSKRKSWLSTEGRGADKGKTPMRGVKRASDASALASSSSAPPPPPPAAATSDGAFWTVCSRCRTQHEYHRLYLNQNLMCSHCRKPFTAVETAPPHSGSIRNNFLEHYQFDSIPHLTDGGKKSRDDDCDALEWIGVSTGENPAAHGSQAVRRESTKRAASPSTNPPPKRRNVVEAAGSNLASSSSSAPPPPPKSNSVREFTKVELRNALVRKSKPTIVTNLHDLMSITPETEDVNMANAGFSQDKSAIEDITFATVKDFGSLAINVPYPDFCDFDKNRTEKSFSDDQIWASYDSSERMPRVYFRIDKVLSVDPFTLCITKLTTSEPMSSDPLGLGVPRTCGVFRPGKSKICESPYIFSHKVEAVKGDHGEFLIYPRTGDVWALYKNWSRDWNYLEAGGKEVEYDVVEVFEGYTEEYGVKVVPLMKVAGSASVFRHYEVPDAFRSFSKDELSRFSHQIPSYLLTGRDAADEYRGCRQLDPTATPSQLLKVIHG